MKVRNKNYILQVTIRDRGLCRCCGFKGSEVHHVIPLVYGGEDNPRNMILLCSICHMHTPDTREEFFEYIKRGGARLEMMIGRIINMLEEKNLNVSIYYPQVKEIIKSLRNVDKNNCFEKYSLKESLEVEEVDFNDLITKCDKKEEQYKEKIEDTNKQQVV